MKRQGSMRTRKIVNNVVVHSFTSEERLLITKSKAVYVEGDSFKIGY